MELVDLLLELVAMVALALPLLLIVMVVVVVVAQQTFCFSCASSDHF